MADALDGSFLHAGTDSTAALLAQYQAEHSPVASSEGTTDQSGTVPEARTVADAPTATPATGQTGPTADDEAEARAKAKADAKADADSGEGDADEKARRQRRKKPEPWALKAINESFLDNRINGETWDTFGYRLVPDVKARLEKRLIRDKRSSNNRRLAQGHYVNAAMLRVPDSIEERLKIIRDFQRQRGGVTDPGRPTNYRVSAPAFEMSRDLDMEITEAAKRGLVIFLFSAAVEQLLDALEAEGPLLRPEIFRPVQ
ncbi:hypothetical protein AB0G85_35940 [Streptomyces sioyaensis]|uniref:hypothetical protein n=1 Tax=Streptomyces sioyaensis TaxID=67364 RepID=UPI0034104B84